MPYGTYFRPGDWNIIDDMSGFRLKRSQARRIPGGQTGNLLVDAKRWEPQQPQDFTRGVVDDQSLPAGEARPRQPNRFTITATFIVAQSPRQGNVITVDSTEGFSVNDRVAVMLDSGENYFPTIVQIVGTQMWLSRVLPSTVGGPYSDLGMSGNYGPPIENTVLSLGASGDAFLVDDNGNIPIVDDTDNLFNVS